MRHPIHGRDFFRLRMNEEKVDACVKVNFTIGNSSFCVTHSLYDDTLLSVNVDDKALEGDIYSYRKYEEMYFAQVNKSTFDDENIQFPY